MTSAEVTAARVRAALAYAALTYEDAADLIPNMGPATLRRIASPKNPRGAELHELAQIARACGVTPGWLTAGQWHDEAPPQPAPYEELGHGTAQRRLAVVEHYLGLLLALELERTGAQLPLAPPATRAPRQLGAGRSKGR
jgi:hypothetical protein